MVYLAAGLPLEGRTVLEATGGATTQSEGGGAEVTQLMTDETGMLRFIRPDAGGRMECFDFEAVRDFCHHDCDEATAKWAYSRLRPAPVEFLVETVSLGTFWQANLPRSYIRCLQDRPKPVSSSLEIIGRLGFNTLTIDRSHSPLPTLPPHIPALRLHPTPTR